MINRVWIESKWYSIILKICFSYNLTMILIKFNIRVVVVIIEGPESGHHKIGKE